MGDHGIRQVEKLFLTLHPIHLRPCTEPHRADPQRMSAKADILGGNRPIHDPVILGIAESPFQITADKNSRGGAL